MAYNGSGSYSPPSSSFPAVSGALIESAKFNNIVNDIASALSTAITKDGQTTVMASLPMAGYRHTGVGNAVARTDYAAAGQVQDSSMIWAGTAGGTANAITLTLAPAPTAYAAGQSFTYKSGASANTGAMTANVNGLGAKAIQKNGAALASGDHPANSWFRVTYDGAAFQLEQIQVTHGPVFRAYASADQSVASGVITKVTLGLEDFDTASCFASSRFTPNVAGYYQIDGAVKANSPTMVEIIAAIFKNGSLYHIGQADVFAATNKSTTATVSTVVHLNGSTDYVELFGQVTGGTPKFAYTGVGNTSIFSGCFLRP